MRRGRSAAAFTMKEGKRQTKRRPALLLCSCVMLTLSALLPYLLYAPRSKVCTVTRQHNTGKLEQCCRSAGNPVNHPVKEATVDGGTTAPPAIPLPGKGAEPIFGELTQLSSIARGRWCRPHEGVASPRRAMNSPGCRLVKAPSVNNARGRCAGLHPVTYSLYRQDTYPHSLPAWRGAKVNEVKYLVLSRFIPSWLRRWCLQLRHRPLLQHPAIKGKMRSYVLWRVRILEHAGGGGCFLFSRLHRRYQFPAGKNAFGQSAKSTSTIKITIRGLSTCVGWLSSSSAFCVSIRSGSDLLFERLGIFQSNDGAGGPADRI